MAQLHKRFTPRDPRGTLLRNIKTPRYRTRKKGEGFGPLKALGLRSTETGEKSFVGIKSGENILRPKIRELKLGVPSDQFPKILERIQAFALQNKGRALTDADLIKIIREP